MRAGHVWATSLISICARPFPIRTLFQSNQFVRSGSVDKRISCGRHINQETEVRFAESYLFLARRYFALPRNLPITTFEHIQEI